MRRHYFAANGPGGTEQTTKAGLIRAPGLPQKKREGGSKKPRLVVADAEGGYNDVVVVVVGEDDSKEGSLLRSKASESR